jgi:hypothetical protein
MENQNILRYSLPSQLKNYETKYDDFINSKNFYNMLLSVKTDLRKILRKNLFEEYIEILFYASDLFCSNKEINTATTLLVDIIEELEKSNQVKAENIQKLLTSKLNNLLNRYPSLFFEDRLIMRKFLLLGDSKKFNEECDSQIEIFKTFSNLCSLQNDFMYAYKIALKTKDFNLINSNLERLSCNFLPTEKEFFVARTVLELLMKKQIALAKNILKYKIDHRNNLQNNNPIINYVFLLCILLENKESKGDVTFNHFEILIKKYSIAIENEPSLKKYLNSISKDYFNRKIIEEDQQGNNGLENLMKMFG